MAKDTWKGGSVGNELTRPRSSDPKAWHSPREREQREHFDPEQAERDAERNRNR